MVPVVSDKEPIFIQSYGERIVEVHVVRSADLRYIN